MLDRSGGSTVAPAGLRPGPPEFSRQLSRDLAEERGVGDGLCQPPREHQTFQARHQTVRRAVVQGTDDRAEQSALGQKSVEGASHPNPSPSGGGSEPRRDAEARTTVVFLSGVAHPAATGVTGALSALAGAFATSALK